MELTILMPCLNEEETLEICIRKAMQAIEKYKLNAEILISDNGSTDSSISIATRMGARVINVHEKGYGSALKMGIECARGKYIIMADSDDSYDFSAIYPFLVKLREGSDLVMGNRFKGGIERNAMPLLHKYLGNPVLSFIGKLFFKINIGDFHCGFRGFNRESMLTINLSTPGMEFASEMVVKSSLYMYKISEISVKLYPDGRSRPPHLQTWNDGWRHLRFLLIYSPKWLFLYPGLLLSLPGMIMMLILLPGRFDFGLFKLDVHTMLYCSCFIIIGFQMLSFYCFSRLMSFNGGILHSERFSKMKKMLSLEKGLVTGATIFLCGALLSVVSFFIWNSHSFGDLDPVKMLRVVIPSITLMMLGLQVIVNSFFVSIVRSELDLKLSKREYYQEV